MPAQHRHAYEVVRGPCHLFFDLEIEGEEWQRGKAMAEAVEEAACTMVAELAAEQRLQVRIDTVAMDCDHAAKFSRHLLVCVTADGEPVLWPGPHEAGAVAARVAEWVGGDAAVIDRCVYADGRCFRLLGSRKLCGSHRAPLELNMARSAAALGPLPFAEQVRRSLARPPCSGSCFLEAPAPATAVHAPAEPHARAEPHAPHEQQRAPGSGVPSKRAAPAVSEAAWRRQWRRLTATPLLDVPRMPHPRVLQRRGGVGLPPPPWAELGRWGAGELSRLGACGVARWEVVRSEWPEEWLLHLTARGGCCAHVGRAHRAGNNIMLTVDMMNGLAWQRCFDHACVVRLPGGGYRKARSFVGEMPAAVLPCGGHV